MRQHGKVSEVTEKKTAVYVDDQQRILISQLARGWLWRSELPTWLLIVTVYGGWFACVAGWRTLGLFPATLLLIWFTAWYMSLQHELIHGHPTRLAWFNQLLKRCRWRSGIPMASTATATWRTIATIC